jgi:transposase
VNTIPEDQIGGRNRRRRHSDEFKADVVAACMQPGMSMAAVAMAHGINANLLRRWVRDAELKPATTPQLEEAATTATSPSLAFVPVTVPTSPSAQGVRIELRRGATSITMTWPVDAAADCAAWMRELLR